MKVKIYVEGGGDSKELHSRCRRGFRKLIERAGFVRRMPAVVACGGRGNAFDLFRTAATSGDPALYPMLLLDSEDPLTESADERTSAVAWYHLESRDGWMRTDDMEDDQAQLMVTCMGTWIMADRTALRTTFGAALRMNALLPEMNLETRPRREVQQALETATKDCGRDKAYRKGRKSFQVLEQLDPITLRRHLPYFQRFVDALNRHLS